MNVMKKSSLSVQTLSSTEKKMNHHVLEMHTLLRSLWEAWSIYQGWVQLACETITVIASYPKYHISFTHLELSMVTLILTEGPVNESKHK